MANHENPMFRRGVLPLMVLGLLKQEDMYGYQMVQAIYRFSDEKMLVKEGSLYPVLYRLEEEGLISFHKEQTGKRMVRTYYHLEHAGEQRLQELIQEYNDTTRLIFRIVDNEGGNSNDNP